MMMKHNLEIKTGRKKLNNCIFYIIVEASHICLLPLLLSFPPNVFMEYTRVESHNHQINNRTKSNSLILR